MRVAVIADIHGNYQALKAVLEDIESQEILKIISLGDNIGYGPEPEEVVKALTAKNVTSIMGNHELALVSKSYFKRLNQIPQDSLILSLEMLSKESLKWLENLHPVYFWQGARFVHGSPPQSITAYLFSPTHTRLQRLFLSFPERICFAGHTHSIDCFTFQENKTDRIKLSLEQLSLSKFARYIILPGSVGQPRDDVNSTAKYCIWDLEKEELEMRGIQYDVETTIRLLKERGFHHFNAMRLKWAGK